MQYVGSKNRIAKEILPIILADRKSEKQWYVEPFVGGCNMIDKVSGWRIGNDTNVYLVAMWRALQSGWVPKENYSREEYYYYRERHNMKDVADINHIIGFVGFTCSFGSKFFGGYVNPSTTKGDYQQQARKNILKQLENIKGVIFSCLPYDKIYIPPKSVIYCDPPYKGTTGYSETGSFDPDSFWQWCRYKQKEGHSVFISEYAAPDDFMCVWSKEINSQIHIKGPKRSTEKLFKLKY